MSNQNHFLVNVNDISDYQTAGLMKMQHLFQTTLTNGLSHERLTPLNGIILNSFVVLEKIRTTIETEAQNSNNSDQF